MPSTAIPDAGPQTFLPPVGDPDQADMSALLDEIASYLAQHTGEARLTAADGTSTPIPQPVYEVLRAAVAALSRGTAVTITPVSTRLTTSQAAEILGISRPTLIRLLEDGAIPYKQPRRHRLLRLVDVLDFQKQQRAQRRLVLDEMTRSAVEAGLYESSVGDYTQALADARSTAV